MFVIPETPIGLTIAGSDCSAGAGLQADLASFLAHGVYGLSVVTAIVAEAPGRVVSVQPVSDQSLEDQLQLLLETYPIGAAKTGMLHSANQIQVIVNHLQTWKRHDPNVRLVVDPVMVATSGTRLLQTEAIDVLRMSLVPLADLITPNLPEAAVLLGVERESSADPVAIVEKLAEICGTNVLLKGGHADGDLAIDYLITETGVTAYEAERLPGPTLHGTGCTLSASITAHLAKGRSLEDAVGEAKVFITEAMRHAHQWGNVRALDLMKAIQ